jgi:hypothetical protein
VEVLLNDPASNTRGRAARVTLAGPRPTVWSYRSVFYGFACAGWLQMIRFRSLSMRRKAGERESRRARKL